MFARTLVYNCEVFLVRRDFEVANTEYKYRIVTFKFDM